MSDVPMHPQPPSHGDNSQGHSNPAAPGGAFDVQQNASASDQSWLLDDGPDPVLESLPHHEVQALPDDLIDASPAGGEWLADPGGDPMAPAAAAPAEDDSGEYAPDGSNTGGSYTGGSYTEGGYTEGGYADEEALAGTSYVEPESKSRPFTRAIMPGVAALLVSFGGIALWSFLRPADGGDTQVARVDSDVKQDQGDEAGRRGDVKLATPSGGSQSSFTSGRLNQQRDGAAVAIGGGRQDPAPTSDATSTVVTPREPGELPVPTVTDGGPEAAALSEQVAESEEWSDATGAEPQEWADEADELTVADSEPAFPADEWSSPTAEADVETAFLEEFVIDIAPIDDSTGDIAQGEQELDPLEHALAEMAEPAEHVASELDVAVADTEEEDANMGSGIMLEFEDDTVASLSPDLVSGDVSTSVVVAPFDGVLPVQGPVDAYGALVFGPEVAMPAQSMTEGESHAAVDDGFPSSDAEDAYSVEPPPADATMLVPGTEGDEIAEGDAMETDAAETETDVAAADVSETPATDESEWSDEWSDEWADEWAPVEDEVADEAVATIAAGDLEFPLGAPTDEFTMVDESVEPQANADATSTDEGTVDDPAAATSAAEFQMVETEAHARLDAIFGAMEPIEAPEPDLADETDMQAHSDDEALAAADPWLQLVPDVSDEFPAPPPVDSTQSATDDLAMAPIGPDVQETRAPEQTEDASPAGSMLPDQVAGSATASATGQDEAPDDLSDVDVEIRGSIAGEAPRRKYAGVLTRVGDDRVWRHKSVPKRKTDSETMVLTPNVGPVRVIFDGGESIDGRLHAVGQNKIVLDTKMGRMTLDARRADRIDRLTNSTRSLRSPATTGSTSGLDRVRVRTKGGSFYGHLVSREGDKVTLLLDEGFRITLESNDVTPMIGKKAMGSRLRRIDK